MEKRSTILLLIGLNLGLSVLGFLGRELAIGALTISATAILAWLWRRKSMKPMTMFRLLLFVFAAGNSAMWFSRH